MRHRKLKHWNKSPNFADAVRLVAGALVLGLAMAPGAARADAALDKLYPAAMAEGKVSVFSPPSAILRKELTDAFTKRFPGIEIEIQGMPGNSAFTKVRTEERAGIHAVDAILGSATVGVSLFKPANLLRPLDPMIVSAEARDPSKWMGGGFDWADADKTVMAMMSVVIASTMYNSDMVKRGEITSDKDLLDPKWKGKIAINDPTIPGAARLVFRHFYDLHGPEYIRSFFANQNPVVTKDLRQLVDWVAKGTYPVALGYSPTVVNALVVQGITNLGLDNAAWKDQQVISPGFGGLIMPTKVPHSAAAQLFINWVLTREGQTAMVNGMQYVSRRLDVSQDPVPEYLRPVKGKDYLRGYTEEYYSNPNEEKVKDLLKELKIGAR